MSFFITGKFIKSAVLLGAAGGGFAVYKIVSKAENLTYGSKFKGGLIAIKGDVNKDIWHKRLAALRADATREDSLVREFKKIKKTVTGDYDWKALQKVCWNVSGEESSKTGTKLDNFGSYCVLTIEEKLGNVIGRDVVNSDGKWAEALNTLRDYRGSLNLEFLDLKNKSGTTVEEVKELCVKHYDNPFVSLEDISVKSVSAICTFPK